MAKRNKSKTTQLSLFEGQEKSWEIKKHSSIVQINNVPTLQERKTMNALIWITKDILKREPNKQVFECDISTVKRLTGLQATQNEDLKDALRNLAETTIEYNIFGKDKSKERGIFSFLAYAKINTQGKGKPTSIKFEFPSIILDMVKHPNIYVTLNLLILKDLDSKHSMGLYEFLKDYKNIGHYHCSIEDFRRLMGIKTHQYNTVSMLRRRVLDVAVEEINTKTDINVDYELERCGRKVAAIYFSIHAKAHQSLGKDKQQAIKKKLEGFGLQDIQIESLLQRHDEEYLWANISIVEEQYRKGKISNVTAYLLKAFEVDYRPTETDLEKEKQALEAQKQTDQEQAAKEAEAKETAKLQFFAERKQLIEEVLANLPKIEVEQLKQDFIASKASNSLSKKMIESKGLSHPMIEAWRHQSIAEQFLEDRYKGFEVYWGVKSKKL